MIIIIKIYGNEGRSHYNICHNKKCSKIISVYQKKLGGGYMASGCIFVVLVLTQNLCYTEKLRDHLRIFFS